MSTDPNLRRAMNARPCIQLCIIHVAKRSAACGILVRALLTLHPSRTWHLYYLKRVTPQLQVRPAMPSCTLALLADLTFVSSVLPLRPPLPCPHPSFPSSSLVPRPAYDRLGTSSSRQNPRCWKDVSLVRPLFRVSFGLPSTQPNARPAAVPAAPPSSSCIRHIAPYPGTRNASSGLLPTAASSLRPVDVETLLPDIDRRREVHPPHQPATRLFPTHPSRLSARLHHHPQHPLGSSVWSSVGVRMGVGGGKDEGRVPVPAYDAARDEDEDADADSVCRRQHEAGVALGGAHPNSKSGKWRAVREPRKPVMLRAGARRTSAVDVWAVGQVAAGGGRERE
ncbi:hypothetical protein MVEN_01100700 [Mycena venus]|uniref:Uncharacterized protein n=1 Tax=Mycena venus TaxID=2733690 RepID=A0A8H7D0F2_9AGAR|nr:hypothetical protein MVEN_01100700 [Mycena venus]